MSFSPANPTPTDDIVDRIFELFARRGDATYAGEAINQTEHALQAAWLAEKAGAPASLITAALLHDLGHLLHDYDENCAAEGIDDRHEELGWQFLCEDFGPAVIEPIRLHVPAKRYRCAVDPGYLRGLSPGSLSSLKLQGGPFTPEEADAFRREPFAEDAFRLRGWDEAAKIVDRRTPDLEHFRPYVVAALKDNQQERTP